MRVAMITPYWFPVRGGVTTYVSQLAEALRQLPGWDVRVISREGSGAGAIALGGSPRQFANRAVAELETFAPDAIHANAHWYTLLAGVTYRRQHPATRLIFTAHTELSPDSATRRRALQHLLSKADFVTAVSADLFSRTVISLKPRTRGHITRPGAANTSVEPAQVQQFLDEVGLGNRRPLIVSVGPLAYEAKSRGVAQLIRAVGAIRAVRPGTTLAIAGDGQYRASLESIAAKELPDGCVFLGTIDNPALLMAAADLVAHISFQEGLPLAVLEAMSLGVPIVASRTGGIPEVVRDGESGILLSGEQEELAHGILRVLGSPDLGRRLAAEALSDAKSRFTWTAAAENFVPLFGGRTRKRVAITVDLEQDYPTSTRSFRGVEEGLPKLLALFRRLGIRAHFFVTADLCLGYADRLKAILAGGHDIGCHGASHQVPYYSAKPFQWQLDSIRRATHTLEACLGVRPRGFRAPNFSVNGKTIAALDATGYEHDSSVLPGRRVRRIGRTLLDFLSAPRLPYHPSSSNPATPGNARILEIPVTENPIVGGGPLGLGFVNARGVAETLEALGTSVGSPTIFLIHPWELVDPPKRGPLWMASGCTSDTTKIEAFLDRLVVEHDLTTLQNESVNSLSFRSEIIHENRVPEGEI